MKMFKARLLFAWQYWGNNKPLEFSRGLLVDLIGIELTTSALRTQCSHR